IAQKRFWLFANCLKRKSKWQLANAMALTYLAQIAVNVCHLDRPRGSEATECEWRNPENAYTTMLMQGIFTRTLSLTPIVPESVVRAAWGERPRIGNAGDTGSGFLDYVLSRFRSFGLRSK